MSANTQPLEGVDPNVYKALDDYWKYLHNYDKDEMAYEYSLKHYDQNILSKIDKQIVQMWSFKPFETAGKNAGITLTSGSPDNIKSFMDDWDINYTILTDVEENETQVVTYNFGKEIAKLVDGVTKLNELESKPDQSKAAEDFRKLILASSSDIRVLLIKIADRLHNMRTLKYLKNKNRRK